LQLRSVVAAALGILIALVVVGAAISVLVSHHLHRSLDHTLRQRAIEIAQLSASAPALLTTPGALDSPLGGTQLIVEVVDARGRIVARSLSLGGRVLPTAAMTRNAIGSGHPAYSNAQLGTERLRAYAAPLAALAGPAAGGAVVVAASTHDLGETLASLHLFALFAGLLAAALGAGVVALLMRHALRPLGRLAAAATEIELTGDSRRRLPQPASADEVGQLAGTLNAMLASLERAREGERRFLADASHELRTPLTALRGNVAYIVRHGATPAVIAELEEDAERLARLADDLLVLAREESGAALPTEHIFLDELATAVAEEDAGIDVFAPGPVVVRGDRAALERAITNLVQNGRRYGPAGGRIRLEVESSKGLASVTVADEGPGLQPYEADRAFERFWRGLHGRSGSGLGLAIVRATAERHGGRAYANGAHFTIELPVLRDLSEFDGRTTEDAPEKGSL
ncbi:MAG: two-component system, OmpR family, sensor kinase, partial [Gaiellaceae bacterium]|nr:two-component system, OmpR family, sensor kinase [Gaiellaceae bacterium]